MRFLQSIAETVLHAHGRQVFHRDLKPANILASYEEGSGTWKAHLTDFDLAWYSTRSMSTKEAYGAIHYAAPEQLMRPKSPEAHQSTVDVYSFGQLCFYAAVDRDPMPMTGDLKRAAGDLRVFLDEWPSGQAAAEFEDLFVSCVRENPRERIQGFDEISARLAKILFLLRDLQVGTISPQRLLQEAAYAVSGVTAIASNDSDAFEFQSLSGRTSIALTVADVVARDKLLIQIRVSPLQQPTFQGASSKEARRLFGQRIDRSLERSPLRAERDGRVGCDYDFVLRTLPLRQDVEGLSTLQQLLSSVVGAAEAV